MTKRLRLMMMLAVLLAPALMSAPAHAQLARTFVSSNGNDANDCNRSTPCRTFQRAHDNTLAAGEITVLDPGGYGAVTINKSISIINDGVGEAGALVSGGVAGITISAGASDAVNLRGLTVKGIGFGGGNGIVFNSGRFLTIENCVVRGLTGAQPIGNGIRFQPTALSTLSVSNTLVSDNEHVGIYVAPTGASAVRAALSRVEAYHNENGIVISGVAGTGSLNATVADSVTSGNTSTGVLAISGPGGGTTSAMVVRTVTANNTNGLLANANNAGNVTLRFGQTTVTGNANSWTAVLGGLVRSYGDNNIDGNADGDPLPVTIATK